MRARSMSSLSDLRRPVILVAPPSRAVCRSDMHVHGEPFSASDVCTYVPMDEYCVCMDVYVLCLEDLGLELCVCVCVYIYICFDLR